MEYKIADKMVSSVVSISEKIGRLKEIRRVNKHLDFDQACIVRNIQRILKGKNIIYSDRLISDSLGSEHSIRKEDVESILPIIEFHTSHLTNKELDINTYAEAYNSNEYFEEIPTWKLDQIIERTDFSPQFFLYALADFCKECNNLTPDYFIEGWLINCFYEEYGIILSLTYNNYLEEQKKVDVFAHFVAQTPFHEDPPRYEFFLSVIDTLLDGCIEYYYFRSQFIVVFMSHNSLITDRISLRLMCKNNK